MKLDGIGITGLGVYLPEPVRSNSYWPPEVVAGFRTHGDDLGRLQERKKTSDPELAGIVSEEMGRWKEDPFHGIRERRVAPPGMTSSEMEFAAARAAIENAGIKRTEIDLLLVQSVVPDRALSTNPAMLHRRLELPTTCAGIETDRTCGGLMFQLQMAGAYLKASGARHALLVQSSLLSRILDYTNPVSTTFGDAASAIVLSRVSEKRGIRSLMSFMNGHYDNMAVLSPADDGPWYCGAGPLTLKSQDKERLREIPEVSAAGARDSIRSVLAEAGIEPAQVKFFLGHQPTASFNTICRRAAGLGNVPTVDTYATLGATGSCVIPMNLQLALQQKKIQSDDAVVMFSTGAGINWSAAVLRWGS